MKKHRKYFDVCNFLITWLYSILLVSLTLIIYKNYSTFKESTNNSNKYEIGIVQINDGIQPEIIYDKTTGVMYFISDSGIITPILKEDGKPQIYEN